MLSVRSGDGFGLVQSLICIALIGIVSSIAIPATRDALIAQRGRASTANLRVIEEAKRQFVLHNPGATDVTAAELSPYLPNGNWPSGVHTGEIYYIKDPKLPPSASALSNLAVSSVNGNSTFEPWSNQGPLVSNGYNDLGSVAPVVVINTVPVPHVDQGNLIDLPPRNPCQWVIGEWGACSCDGLQYRTVVTTLPGCTPIATQPPTVQNCTPITGTWATGAWSACSCDGTQTRSVTLEGGSCPPAGSVPATTQSCSPPSVGIWVLGTATWSACSAPTCASPGTQHEITPYVLQNGTCPPAGVQPDPVIGKTQECAAIIPPGNWILGIPVNGPCSSCTGAGTLTRTTPYISSAGCPPLDAKPDDLVQIVECDGRGTEKTWVLGTPVVSDCSACNGNGTKTTTTPYVLSEKGTCPPITTQPPDKVETEPCTGSGTPGTWQTGEWSECSCDGEQSRSVTPSGDCEPPPPKPPEKQTCTPDRDTWDVGDWSDCSCAGEKTRTVMARKG